MYKHHPNPSEINVVVVNADKTVFQSIQDSLTNGRRASYNVEWKSCIENYDQTEFERSPHVLFLDLLDTPDDSIHLVEEMIDLDIQVPLVLLSDADNSDEKLIQIEEQICEDTVAEAIPKTSLDTATIERCISNVLHHLDVENELIQDEEKLEVMLNEIDESVIGLDANFNIVSMNAAAEKMAEVEEAVAKGQYFFNFFKFVEDITNENLEPKIVGRMRNEESFHFGPDAYLVGGDYSKVFVEVSVAPLVCSHKVTGYLIIINDDSLKRRWSNKFSFQFSHDPVTGLLNRTGFESSLQQSISVAEENETTLRTNHENSSPQTVLDGNLTPFIEASLKAGL